MPFIREYDIVEDVIYQCEITEEQAAEIKAHDEAHMPENLHASISDHPFPGLPIWE
jgi:hypothetical protein